MNIYLATPATYEAGAYMFSEATKEEKMDVYLAGIVSRPFVIEDKKEMDIYLAATSKKQFVIEEKKEVDIYLAGAAAGNNSAEHKSGEARELFYKEKISVLESFFYVKDWMIPYIKNDWHFLLDSGAFTFLADKKNSHGVDWDAYINRYADFINKHDIELFFELDIDPVVGITEVERLRANLERLTGKQSIPVWHKSRGLDYWKKMCLDYSYVAIGGIVTREIKDHDIFIPLLSIARKNKCKVHGLGFTPLNGGLKKYKFHSTDSTAWIYGNRGGFLYHFNGKELLKRDKPDGTRLRAKDVAIHNFKEWIKFQRYAKDNL